MVRLRSLWLIAPLLAAGACASFGSTDATQAPANPDAALTDASDGSSGQSEGGPGPVDAGGGDAGPCSPGPGWTVEYFAGGFSASLDATETLAAIGHGVDRASHDMEWWERASAADPWTPVPGRLDNVNNADPTYKGHVWLSPDGLSLLFSSDERPTVGMVKVATRGSRTAPFSAGAEAVLAGEASGSHPYALDNSVSAVFLTDTTAFAPRRVSAGAGRSSISLVVATGATQTVGVVMFEGGNKFYFSPRTGRQIMLATGSNPSYASDGKPVDGLWCDPSKERYPTWTNSAGSVVYFAEATSAFFAPSLYRGSKR